jgi:hypothetical protein
LMMMSHFTALVKGGKLNERVRPGGMGIIVASASCNFNRL